MCVCDLLTCVYTRGGGGGGGLRFIVSSEGLLRGMVSAQNFDFEDNRLQSAREAELETVTCP